MLSLTHPKLTIGWIVCMILLVPVPTSAEESDEEPSDKSEQKQDVDYSAETTRKHDPFTSDEDHPSGFTSHLETKNSGPGQETSDALESAPGSYVKRSGGYGQSSYLQLRGGNPRQASVSLNGMAIDLPAGIGFDIGTLSIDAIDSLDIHRGPTSISRGATPLTGGLNINISAPREPGRVASVETTAGSFGTYGGSASISKTGQSSGGEVSITWRQSDGDFTFKDAQKTQHNRMNNHHKQVDVVATGFTELEGYELETTLYYTAREGGVAGPSEFQKRFRDTALELNRLIGILNWDKNNLLDGSSWALDGFGHIGGQWRLTNYSNDNIFPGSGYLQEETTYWTTEVQVGKRLWWDFGNILTASFQGNLKSYDSEVSGSRNRGSGTDIRRTQLRGELSNELLLFDRHLSFITGASMLAIGDSLQKQKTNTREHDWFGVVPTAGVIGRVFEWLKLKSNLIYSYRPPELDELYLQRTGIRGNPDLEPERALSFDAGFQLGNGKWPLRLEAVYFRNNIENYIEFVAKSAWLYESENLKNARTEGFEGTLQLNPIERLGVQGNYTYTEATIYQNPELPLPGQPEHRVYGSVTAEFAGLVVFEDFESAKLTSTTTHRTEVYLDRFGHRSNPAHTTLDLSSTVQPFDWGAFQFEVTNLFDNQRGADFLQRPLPGRAYYIGLNLTSRRSE